MQVQIQNGLLNGKELNGVYETDGTTNKSARWNDPKDHKVNVIINGKSRMAWCDRADFAFIGSHESVEAPIFAPVVEETDEEMVARITKRFTVMDKMADGLIKGTIRSLIISGAPGIGKTYTLEEKLNNAVENGEIEFKAVKGKCSPIGLYITLWEMRDEGCVVELDDVDVFSNEDFLNVLKAALDSGDKRIVSWGTASNYLEEKQIPNEFEFKGSIVFITNTNIDKEVERGTKMAPHLDALQSRSIYLDLGVHSAREIMSRVTHVVETTDMLQRRGLSNAQTADALHWMQENMENLRSVSLRTALYLADFINTDEDWADLAEVTLLK
ncbi:hypothetical protein Asfd1_40 [Aeromonas phage Asfd_1]|nr:hypothetical protein Asfd1_40 [Aeromonas phage Asfd_1]